MNCVLWAIIGFIALAAAVTTAVFIARAFSNNVAPATGRNHNSARLVPAAFAIADSDLNQYNTEFRYTDVAPPAEVSVPFNSESDLYDGSPPLYTGLDGADDVAEAAMRQQILNQGEPRAEVPIAGMQQQIDHLLKVNSMQFGRPLDTMRNTQRRNIAGAPANQKLSTNLIDMRGSTDILRPPADLTARGSFGLSPDLVNMMTEEELRADGTWGLRTNMVLPGVHSNAEQIYHEGGHYTMNYDTEQMRITTAQIKKEIMDGKPVTAHQLNILLGVGNMKNPNAEQIKADLAQALGADVFGAMMAAYDGAVSAHQTAVDGVKAANYMLGSPEMRQALQQADAVLMQPLSISKASAGLGTMAQGTFLDVAGR